MKITNFLMTLALAALALAGCDDKLDTTEAPIKVESLVLDEAFANGHEVVVGQSFNIAGQVTTIPLEATDKMESFSSLNAAIATVDETGRVITHGVGKTVLTITVNGQSVQFLLDVISRITYDVTAIDLAQTSYEPDVNQTFDLFSRMRLTPVEAEPLDVTFSSSNSSVAEVDANGLVTGKSTGNAVITVASKHDPNVRATFTLDVFAPSAGFTVDANGVLTAYSGPGGELRVPATAKSIASSVFNGNATITSIHLNGVETVGSDAFRNCSGLVRVIGPNVSVINGNAFNSCPELVEFVGDKLLTLQNAVFQFCRKLKTINLENVTFIGQFCCYDTALESVYMPSLVTVTQRKYQFSLCSKLVSVDMPRLTTIAVEGMFENCPVLTSVNLPSLELFSTAGTDGASYGQATFNGCTTLARISLPRVTNLKENTFNGCTALTRLDLSGATGLTTVAASAIPAGLSGLKVYVATAAIKALFPAEATYEVIVGTPPA
jgi:uncharacterized protein YjdB